jgi:hypothetical protein
MMAAIAIDHLCGMAEGNDIGIAYLFCNYKAQTDQSAPSLLAALVKQLVQSRPEITAPVTHVYDQHSKRGSRPSRMERGMEKSPGLRDIKIAGEGKGGDM